MQVLEENAKLLIKDGKYKKVITKKLFFQKVEDINLNDEFIPKYGSIESIINNERLIKYFNIIKVEDNEICIVYLDNNYKGVLKSGKHLFWKSNIDFRFDNINIEDENSINNIRKDIILVLRLLGIIKYISISPNQKGLLFIDNKFEKELDSGEYDFWQNKNIIVERLETRVQLIEIVGQDLLTKDKVNIRLNLMCQYQIIDIKKCIENIKEYDKHLHILLQLILREYIGQFNLDEILQKKEEINNFIIQKIKEKADILGVNIINVGVKDVILPGEIKDIMNQVLIAEKKAQANVITRREETASTRSLLNTAKLLDENKTLYHLKELEYIERISEKISQISLNGNGIKLLDDLKNIFIPKKDNN